MTKKPLPTNDLTVSQKSDIAKWSAHSSPARKEMPEFNNAWKAATTAELRREELSRPTTKWDRQRRKHLERQKAQMDGRITPAKRRKAIEDREPLVARCSEKIRERGAPENITAFIAELRAEGVTKKPRTQDKVHFSDTTIKNVLRYLLGIRGTRGPGRRKPE